MSRIKTIAFMAFVFIVISIPVLRVRQAEAASYSKAVNWPLKQSSAPPGPSDAVNMASILVHSCVSGCPSEQTGQWASSWSYVDCVAAARPTGGYNYYMNFQAENGDWPTTWPSTVTCSKTLGDDVYTATVSIVDVLGNSWGLGVVESGWNPSDGLAFNFVSQGDREQIGGSRYLEAPSSTYNDGSWTAVKSGSVWNGVKCHADDRTNRGLSDVVWVDVNENATEGTGTCVIPKGGGQFFTFSVTVDRP